MWTYLKLTTSRRSKNNTSIINNIEDFWNTLYSSLTPWHDSSRALAMLTADFCMHQLHVTYRLLYVHSCCRPLSTYIPPPSPKCVSIVQRLGLNPPLGSLANSPSKLRMSWDKAPRTFLLWQPASAANPWTWVSSIPWRQARGWLRNSAVQGDKGHIFQCSERKYLLMVFQAREVKRT